MAEKLDDLITAITRSLAQANNVLVSDANEGMSYLVTELEVSIPFTGIEMEGNNVLVDIDNVSKTEHISDQFFRFKVYPLPDMLDVVKQIDPNKIKPEIQQKNLEDSLIILEEAGIPLEKVQIKFDPDAKLDEGSIVDYQIQKASHPATSDEIILTIAGSPPSAVKTPNRPDHISPERKSTPKSSPTKRKTRRSSKKTKDDSSTDT